MAAKANAKANAKAESKAREPVAPFTQLENVTPEKVTELFKGPAFDETPQAEPLFVFVVGAPGVGKSTQTKRFLNTRYGSHFYESMYNMSLDTIVEHIEPYRRYTSNTYKALKANRNVTNKNYAELSKTQLSVLRTQKSNFLLANQNSKRRSALGLNPSMHNSVKATKVSAANASAANVLPTNVLAANVSAPKSSRSGTIKTQPRTNGKPGNEYWCEHCSKWFKTKKTVEDHMSRTQQNGGSILEVFEDAIIYGIQHRYNIIYDTTLNGTSDKADKIMGYIKEFAPDYKVLMILIEADVKTIQHRLRSRHGKMGNAGFLRAINPLMTEKFIKDNKDGFEATKKKYFKYPKFMFSVIDNNPQHNSPKSAAEP
jgi:deoxyadenosine/deoxycytidine kinase